LRTGAKVLRFLEDLFSEEETNEPGFDPAHLGTAILAAFCAIGGLYWLLWTLLVYEGGLAAKVLAGLEVLATSKTAADFGWEGWPYELGVFEGFLGNLGALAILGGLLWLLADLYRNPWTPTRD